MFTTPLLGVNIFFTFHHKFQIGWLVANLWRNKVERGRKLKGRIYKHMCCSQCPQFWIVQTLDCECDSYLLLAVKRRTGKSRDGWDKIASLYFSIRRMRRLLLPDLDWRKEHRGSAIFVSNLEGKENKEQICLFPSNDGLIFQRRWIAPFWNVGCS